MTKSKSKELEVRASKPAFIPVDVNAGEPLTHPELSKRVHHALGESADALWSLKNSENHAQWSPGHFRQTMKETRQRVIREFNEEMLAKN